MVNCDETCDRWMRFKCVLISFWYRIIRRERPIIEDRKPEEPAKEPDNDFDMDDAFDDIYLQDHW